MYTIPAMTIMASTIKPVAPLRLSCRMSQIKNATSSNKKTEKKIIEGAPIFLKVRKTESPQVRKCSKNRNKTVNLLPFRFQLKKAFLPAVQYPAPQILLSDIYNILRWLS